MHLMEWIGQRWLGWKPLPTGDDLVYDAAVDSMRFHEDLAARFPDVPSAQASYQAAKDHVEELRRRFGRSLPFPVEARHLGPFGLYWNRQGWDLRIMLPGLRELQLLRHRR